MVLHLDQIQLHPMIVPLNLNLQKYKSLSNSVTHVALVRYVVLEMDNYSIYHIVFSALYHFGLIRLANILS